MFYIEKNNEEEHHETLKQKGRASMPEDTKPALHQHPAELDGGYPSIEFDSDKYRNDISEYEYTTEQENEMLRALWDMMIMMADLGWGADSVQMLLPALFEKSGTDSGKSLQQNISEEFNPAVSDTYADKEIKND